MGNRPKYLIVLAGAAALVAGTWLATPAADAAATTVTATTTLHARPDSGFSGNTWANDSLTRVATVTLVGAVAAGDVVTDCGTGATACYAYTGTISDTGTAYAITGAISPGSQAVPIKGTPTAAVTGGSDVTFFADSSTPDASLVPTTVTGGNGVSTTNWVEQFFPSTVKFGTGPNLGSTPTTQDWSWMYKDTKNCQTWVDAFNTTKATSGDITGVFSCPDTTTVVSPGNQTVQVGTAVSLQVKASNNYGNTLTYSATNLPAGLSIDSATGLITGTPTAVGTSAVTVTAKDSTGATGSASFTLTVSATPTVVAPSVGAEVNGYGNGFDVFRQHYAANAEIAGWPATQYDVATHFQRVAEGAGFRFEALNAAGAGTGLCVSDPGYDAAGTGNKDGLVLRGCNTGLWQKFVPQSDGTLENAATHLFVNPNGTGCQLRGGASVTTWGGSKYSWKLLAQLPS